MPFTISTDGTWDPNMSSRDIRTLADELGRQEQSTYHTDSMVALSMLRYSIPLAERELLESQIAAL